VSDSTHTYISLHQKVFATTPSGMRSGGDVLGSAGETAPRSRLSTFFPQNFAAPRANFRVRNEILKSNLATRAKIFGRTWRLIKMQIHVCKCSKRRCSCMYNSCGRASSGGQMFQGNLRHLHNETHSWKRDACARITACSAGAVAARAIKAPSDVANAGTQAATLGSLALRNCSI
jgi:hypothetical protein